MWVEADVTDFDALQRAVDACVARFGGIDIAIANAGLAFMGTLAHAPIEQVERTFAVNFLGVWRTNRAVIEQITARRGYLLNITSLSAVAHGPLMGPYTATKAGVEALTNSLRMETAPSGARVGCAYFGFVDTDLVKGSDSQPAGQSLNERLPAFMRDPLPVASAVDAIERGIERRAARFWAPRWVGPMIALRGLLQPLTERRTLQDPASLIADMRLADSSNQESQSDILLGLAAAALEQHRPAAGSFRTEG
jgi:NAD(P)-dependent dehydrogenase (short-subunit alcohol dehydrogenase family)